MPYQHCPSCRLTVHLREGEVTDGPCPRCGATLADLPRRLFAAAPPPSAPAASFARGLDPELVRAVMAGRGGRFRRTAAARRTSAP
jgi:hypothetical protein